MYIYIGINIGILIWFLKNKHYKKHINRQELVNVVYNNSITIFVEYVIQLQAYLFIMIVNECRNV